MGEGKGRRGKEAVQTENHMTEDGKGPPRTLE